MQLINGLINIRFTSGIHLSQRKPAFTLGSHLGFISTVADSGRGLSSVTNKKWFIISNNKGEILLYII